MTEVFVREEIEFLDVYDRAFGPDTIDVLPIDARMETVVVIGDHSSVNGQPINMAASLWLASTHRYGGAVCGNVVIFGCNMQGIETSLHPAVLEEIPKLREPNAVIKYLDPLGYLLRQKATEKTDG